MRAISLVNRLEFSFAGNVLKNAICLGDIDNDGNNELIVGNDEGEIVIFKGNKKWITLSGLSFISCIAVGDVLNLNKNCLVIITGDGWCHIYCCANQMVCLTDSSETQMDESIDQLDGQVFSNESIESEKSESTDSTVNTSIEKEKAVLKQIHMQRIPANTKDILLGDIDGDGSVEMVLGLTDRIIRSYRWSGNSVEASEENQQDILNGSQDIFDGVSGKLIGLNKWECAKQIGSVSLHHTKDGLPALLVAQPGGTFMRIICKQEDSRTQSSDSGEGPSDSGSLHSEGLMSSKVDYQFLGMSRMRNPNISTEIVGNIKTKLASDNILADIEVSESVTSSSSSHSGESLKNLQKQIHLKPDGSPYAVSTLDGTIMLVQNEVILWAIAVNHQIFALSKLDVTANGVDDIIACCWDGQTYILDQNKNSVRFHLNEAVQAFECGYYNIAKDSPRVTCFVYVTFRNKIYLYYDIPLKDIVCKRYEPDCTEFSDCLQDAKLDKNSQRELVNFLLYGV